MSTIAAIATATGIGGIGIVRMSGKECFKILARIFKPKKQLDLAKIKGYTIKYGKIVDGEKVIDEVLVSFFTKPNSYTTEDVCEINSHGGNYVMRKILELCLKNGAVMAEPGEFTKRAFLNGRIDLSQAESVIDIINARAEKEARSSIQQLEGSLSREIAVIREKLLSIMVDIEVSIDYPEYDIEEVSVNREMEVLKEVKGKLTLLQKSFEKGKIIKDGIRIALIGRPNAGKSSLLNALLREDRAIVTAIEGTTRDTIEENVTLRGIPIHIIDTAGIRDTSNEVEKIGIEKSKKMAQNADLVIAILDASRELSVEDEQILELLKNKKYLVILNKIDLPNQKINLQIMEEKKIKNYLEISIKENKNLDKLEDKIEEMFSLGEININNSTLITNIRHKQLVDRAIQEIEDAIQVVTEGLPIDISSISIKNAMERLGEITGEEVTENVIKEIFAKFCLGK